MKPICVLHTESTGISSGIIHLFDENSWKKTVETYEQLQKSDRVSKYKSINLPEQYTAEIGYHYECRRKYTKIHRIVKPEESEPEKRKSQRLEVVEKKSNDESNNGLTFNSTTPGLFPNNRCQLCPLKGPKTINGRREFVSICQTDLAAANVLKAAEEKDDAALLTQIRGVDLKAKEAHWHKSCYKKYIQCLQPDREKTDKSTADRTNDALLANKAFELLRSYIQYNIIDLESSEKLSDLYSRFMNSLKQLKSDVIYQQRYLREKIEKQFPDSLKFVKHSNKEGLVVSHISLSDSEALRYADLDHISSKEVAIHFRRLMWKYATECPRLSSKLTPESLNKGDDIAPYLSEIKRFLCIFCGVENPEKLSPHLERRIDSLLDEMVFIASNGRIKPGKHIVMGLSVKSMTGCVKLITILNRLGSSISATFVDQFETDIANQILERAHNTPDGLLRFPGLATGIAWDNYNEILETLSGLGALNDTVGICFQNIDEQVSKFLKEKEQQESASDPQLLPWKPGKRKFAPGGKDIAPYHKKPKIKNMSFPIRTVPRPPRVTTDMYNDMLWMMSLSLYVTPSWVGWNARLIEDSLPLQRIGYMNNITLPSTRLDVVKETMRISNEVRKECGEEYMVPTYDLAIAKPALKIQEEESPELDSLFVAFGTLHIEGAFDGATGYFLDGSGGLEIMVDVGVLGPGSLNGLVKGRHYNRCGRLFPLLSCAVQILHFRRYLDKLDGLPVEMGTVLETVNKSPTTKTLCVIEENKAYIDFMKQYSDYKKETLKGEHGATARYWMIYVEIISIKLLFKRAIKIMNVDLFIYALDKMVDLFFGVYRPNYARYMCYYVLKLLNIDTTHPGLKEIFEKGLFSIRRTSKSFSRSGVDLTLEQTVNRTGASRLTGMAHFTNSEGAREKWMLNHAVRCATVTNLLERAGLATKEVVQSQLKPYRIKRDNDDLNKVIAGIEARMNPFNPEFEKDDNLYCLTTGKPVSNEVKNDLLNVFSIGAGWRKDFEDGCFSNGDRFEKPIPRRKIKNFASANVKLKSPAQFKVEEIKCTQDLLGRLVYLGTVHKLDPELLFPCPLTPIPLMHARLNGKMHSTDKSKLMNHLKSLGIQNALATQVKTYLIDAMFFIRLLFNIPTTYGGIAKRLLENMVKLGHEADRLDFIADTYKTPSLKDFEREVVRGQELSDSQPQYLISGPEMKRPTDFSNAMKSVSFKLNLLRFLGNEWKKPEYAAILKSKTLYFKFDGACIKYTVTDGLMEHAVVERLASPQHDEADTDIIRHMYDVVNLNPFSNLAVRADDTDIGVNLCYHVSQMPEGFQVWMDAGKSSDNSRCYVDIRSINESQPSDVIKALPGFAQFTGGDYTPSFHWKGKVQPFKLMCSSQKYITPFTNLGTHEPVTESQVKAFEPFVCAMYGWKKLDSVNECRFQIFKKHYKPKNETEPMEKIKGINACMLPPCFRTLTQTVARANYVASIIKGARDPIPTPLQPHGNGFILDNDHYSINWFEGSPVPEAVWKALEVQQEQEQEGGEVDGVTEDNDEDLDHENDELIYGPDHEFEQDDDDDEDEIEES